MTARPRPDAFTGPSGRWTAARKAEVVRLLSAGTLSRHDAKTVLGFSDEELDSLVERLGRFGEAGLCQMKCQELRVA
jgi:hypothetical protein